MKRLFFPYLFLAVFFLTAPPMFPSAETVTVTVEEQEDRDFIRAMFKDGLYSPASEEAEDFLKKYPKGVHKAEIAFLLAQMRVIRKETDKALKLYGIVIADHPDSLYYKDALYLAGSLQADLGKYAEARKNLNELLKKYPRTKYRKMTTYPLGLVAYHSKSWILAEAKLSAAGKIGSVSKTKKKNAKYLLAWVRHFRKKKELAESEFKVLLKGDYTTAQKAAMTFQLAGYERQRKKFREAIVLYDRQMSKFPDETYSNRSRFWKAETYYLIHQETPKKTTNKERRSAIALFSENLKLETPVEPSRSRYHRGWLRYYFKKRLEAAADFQWLQENDPDYSKDLDLTLTRAKIYEKEKLWGRANAALLAGIGARTDTKTQTQLSVRVVQNLIILKNCPEARKRIATIDLKTYPEYKDEFSVYEAECLYQGKKWKEAIAAYSRVPLSYKLAPLVFPNYLDAYVRIKDKAGAIALIDKVLAEKKFKRKKYLFTRKADFQLELKRWSSARKTLEKILKWWPKEQKNPDLLLNLAQTYDHQKKNGPAVENYRKAFDLLPDKRKELKLSVGDILAEKYESQKNYREAVNVYAASLPLLDDQNQKDELILYISKTILDRQLPDLKGSKARKARMKARNWLKKLHAKRNRDINYEASALLGELEIDAKRLKTATKVLTELTKQPITKTRWHVPIHYRLGELYQYRKMWRKALTHYNKVIKSGAKSPERKNAQDNAYQIRKHLKSLKRKG